MTRYGARRHFDAAHLMIKRFKCRFCDLRFSQKVHCKEHEYRHMDVKPYTCGWPGCSMTFRHKSSKIRHERKEHGYEQSCHSLEIPDSEDDLNGPETLLENG